MLKQKLELGLLAGAVAVSRFAFRSRDLYDLDSVNFALGMIRFDTRVHQPHPPGYFLYVCLGRLVNLAVHDANLALVLLSITAGVGSVCMIYLLAGAWFGPRAATFAGLLFLFSPLAWFHGTVALTYSVEAFFSALLGYLCWKIDHGKTSLVVPAAIALGIAAGIRPSSLLFLGPLFLFSMRWAGLRKAALGIAALGLTCISWFVPMIQASGGFSAWFGALSSLWHMVPSKGTIFNSPPATTIARAVVIVFIYFLCFGPASLAPLLARRIAGAEDKAKAVFTAVWVVPALCFFTLIFLKFVNSGYLLLVAMPACIWLGRWIAEWYGKSSWPVALRRTVVGSCAAANVLIFLLFPAYCSYGSVRHFEAELDSVRTAMAQVGSPADLLIVSFDNHLLGYRHAGYYLPGYTTLEYPAAKMPDGARIFSMQDRQTSLLAEIPPTACSRFVLFPLPAGSAEYRQYAAKVQSLLPAADLASVDLNGHQYVTAPIRDLPLLFPEMPAGVAKSF
jgi:hypothetical protein